MKDQIFTTKESLEKINQIEIRQSDYFTNSSYALIAANWALMTYVGVKDETISNAANFININYSAFSIVFAIFFLGYKGLLLTLNLKHYYSVYDTNNKLQFGYDKSNYGKVHNVVDKFKYVFLIISFGAFMIPIFHGLYFIIKSLL